MKRTRAPGYLCAILLALSPLLLRAALNPAALAFGNAGKNILVGPGLVNYDASIFRNFRFGEHRNLQFRGECFNITNTPHFNNPVAAFENPSFGHVTSAFGERRIQLGLKLEF